MKKANLFTPYTTCDDAEHRRHRLYDRSGSPIGTMNRREGVFSITPKGECFAATVESASCGLGCRCGAYLVPKTPRGRTLLGCAAQIDPQGVVVKPVAFRVPPPGPEFEPSALARDLRDLLGKRMVDWREVALVEVPRPGEHYQKDGYAAAKRAQARSTLLVATESGDRFLVHVEPLRNRVQP